MNYAATDPSSRWTGLGRPLHALEVDYNFYNLDTRLEAVEASVTTTVSISDITQPTTTSMLITMSNAASYTLTLPTGKLRSRGAWAPATPYLAEDSFTTNGAYYRVLVDHTSAGTFSPTANDGAGHDYYEEMIPPIGNALPTGGAPGMSLKKSTSTDFAVSWGYVLPNGGTTAQVLAKVNSTDQNFAWTTLSATVVSFHPSTASGLTSTDVAAALEELEVLIGTGGGGASALSDLTDVLFATGEPTVGSLLYFNGTKWIPLDSPDTGGVVWFDGSDWRTTSAPGSNLILKWNGGAWVPAPLRDPTVTALGSSGSVSLDASLGNIFTITPTNNVTLNASAIAPGAEITVIVSTSGTSSFNITPGANFKSQGALATGTVSGKVFAIKFVGDGVAYGLVEVSRTAAM